MILTKDKNSLVKVAGEVKPIDGATQKFPPVAIQSSELPKFFVRVPCNESGQYSATLLPGKYTVSLVDTLPVRVSEKEAIAFEVKSGQETDKLPTLSLRPFKKPDLIGETGLLLQEEFDAEQVDRFVREYMDFHGIPGLSLAIMKNGDVVFGKGFV